MSGQCCRCDQRAAIRGMCNSHYQAKRTKWIRAGLWQRPATAVGATRRVQALVALGWPQVELCRRTGISRGAMSHIARGNVARTSRVRARLIAELYEQLSMTPGPSQHAREHAAARGWAPPLAWDDDTIDEPDARPDTGVAEPVSFAEQWAELEAMGLGWRDAVHRWQITPQALAKRLERDGLPVPAGLYTAAQARRAARAS